MMSDLTKGMLNQSVPPKIRFVITSLGVTAPARVPAGAVPPPPATFEDGAPSWEALAQKLQELQTPEERELPALMASGRGPTSPKAALRLFDAPEGYQPRITLYRDTAAWCPCKRTHTPVYLSVCLSVCLSVYDNYRLSPVTDRCSSPSFVCACCGACWWGATDCEKGETMAKALAC
jgi:hypothetical protein